MSTSSTIKHAFLDPPLNPEDLGVLGPYRVINELGRGGMGFVFRAEDTRLKRIVALKVMNEKIAATAHSRSRFVDEARSMAAVKHDNVATIYEVNDQCNTPFMAMEMLKGGTLEELTRQHQKFEYHQVIHYAVQMARGLAAAHKQGIIHRDIKPANIWIEAELDRVKILDFGLALAKVPVDQLAGRGSVIGTPQYLSPEQARSEPLDDRSDLYSLGVVLFELCTGDLPFKARSVLEQLILTLVHVPPLVSELNAQIPKPLSNLIAQLLEKEPRLRPRSSVELEKMLDKVAIECDAKSDVALTINKLQEQLNRVAVKKPDPFSPVAGGSIADGSSFAGQTAPAIENPFDALPVPSVIPARGLNVASGTLPPPPPKVSRAAKGGSVRSSFGQAKPAKTSVPSYWPIAAVGAAAALLLCVVLGVFLFSSGPKTNVVVAPVPAPGTPSVSEATKPAPVVTQPESPENISAQPAAPTPEITTDTVAAPSIDFSPANPTQPMAPTSPTVDVTQEGNPTNPANVLTPSDSLPDASSTVKTSPQEMALVPSSTPSSVDAAMAPAPDTGDDPSPAPEEVLDKGIPPGTPVETIRTSTRRGADTTVKRSGGTGAQLGENITVMVQKRGKVDVQHSYLRFDLEGIKKDGRRIGNVELVLSLPGGNILAGSSVRVYGVPQEYSDAWAESGPQTLYWENSISKSDLDGVPLLAEVSLTQDESMPALRINDQRLTDFVQSIKENFVTLILAGGASGDKALHFHSRESGQEQAPALDLVIEEKSGK